jgi:SsrA-binding protein
MAETTIAIHGQQSLLFARSLKFAVLLFVLLNPTHGADAFLPPQLSAVFRSQNRSSRSVALFAGKNKKKKRPGSKTVAVNRIAYRNYEVIDTIEAGISLKGTEVKSVRDGKMNLRDGFVRPTRDGRTCLLYKVHIAKCTSVGAEYFQHEEIRPRTLLVHRQEARKLLQQTEQQGMTVIPLRAYWNDGNKLKIEIGLCRGKNVRDKRDTIRERDMKRETSRIIKNFRLS